MKNIGEDLAALPLGDLPATAPWARPTIVPVGYGVPVPTDANPVGTWQVIDTSLDGPWGPVASSRAVIFPEISIAEFSAYPSRWTGIAHHTSAPRGLYRWSTYFPAGINAVDSSASTVGLACETPDGDSAGIYIETAGQHVSPDTTDHLMHVRIAGDDGSTLVDLPWLPMLNNDRVWFEARITDEKFTIVAFRKAGGVFVQFGDRLTKVGHLPAGEWTQMWALSNLNSFDHLLAGPPITWQLVAVSTTGMAPPLRQYPRSDGLTGGPHRGKVGGTVSRQFSLRQGWVNTHL